MSENIDDAIKKAEELVDQLRIIKGPKPSQFKWAPGESDRLALLPIRHADIWEFRDRLVALHWSAKEVDLAGDARDWATMSPEQKQFVKMQLAFFATIDIDVLRNIGGNFISEIDCMEAEMVFAAQADQECTHAESYALQICAVIPDGAERDQVMNAARTMPIVSRMRAWVLKWFDRSLPIGERLVAFAAVEGVMFSASFCALQWLREMNLLRGITDFNAFIARDEGVHAAFACLLVNRYLRNPPTAARVHEIFREVIAIIYEFVEVSLPVSMIGMNSSLMNKYVHHQADRIFTAMGYAVIWGEENPFAFMDKMQLNDVTKSNFFERRSTSYQNVSKAGQMTFAIDDSVPEEV